MCVPLPCPQSKINVILQDKQDDPEYNNWWVKDYCTYDAGAIEPVLYYFPLLLLSMALVLLLIHMAFAKMFKAGPEMEKLFRTVIFPKNYLIRLETSNELISA